MLRFRPLRDDSQGNTERGIERGSRREEFEKNEAGRLRTSFLRRRREKRPVFSCSRLLTPSSCSDESVSSRKDIFLSVEKESGRENSKRKGCHLMEVEEKARERGVPQGRNQGFFSFSFNFFLFFFLPSFPHLLFSARPCLLVNTGAAPYEFHTRKGGGRRGREKRRGRGKGRVARLF